MILLSSVLIISIYSLTQNGKFAKLFAGEISRFFQKFISRWLFSKNAESSSAVSAREEIRAV